MSPSAAGRALITFDRPGEAAQQAAQFLQAVHGDCHVDRRRVLRRVGHRVHRLDADVLVSEHRRDVANQAAPVEGLDPDGDREGTLGRRTSPVDGQHAPRLAVAQPDQVCAVRAVDADAAAERDVAGDRLGRHRPAAACNRVQQVADAVDHHAAGRVVPGGPRGRLEPGRLPLVLAALDGARHLRHGDFAVAESDIERVRVWQLEFVQDLGQRQAAHAQPVDLPLEHLPAVLAILAFVELAEPAAHLAAVAGRGQESQRRHQPVAAGIRLLSGDDLDGVAVHQVVTKRHHPAIHLRAPATMAEIWCAPGRRSRAAWLRAAGPRPRPSG